MRRDEPSPGGAGPPGAGAGGPIAVLGGEWHPQLQRLASSLGGARAAVEPGLSLAPLRRVGSTLEDVRSQLALTAASSLQKLRLPDAAALADDFSLLRRVGAAGEARRPPGMRRATSESTLRAAARRAARPPARPRAARSPPPAAPPPAGEQQQQPWGWLGALNETLAAARAGGGGGGGARRAPSRSASAAALEQLLARPKAALSSAAARLEETQQNLAQNLAQLQAGLAGGRSSLESRLAGLAAAGDAGGGAASPPRAALSKLLRAASRPLAAAGADGGDADGGGGGGQGLRLSRTFLESARRSAAEVEAAIDSLLQGGGRGAAGGGAAAAAELAAAGGDAGGGAGAAAPAAGPFQLAAAARREARRGRDRTRSSLREPGRQVTIVTTAALPWMTGTAVNPLLRAAYLAKDGGRRVTLMIPWLARADQARVFPGGAAFDTPAQQEAYVRAWAAGRTGFAADFAVAFYPGRYDAGKCSILPVGDPTAYVPPGAADVAVLEEPEHLTWYHAGARWTDKFSHVVGVVHTNYLDYARRERGGAVKEALLRRVNELVCGVHCHKVVKLSDAVQPLPKQTTRFVHGVAENFLAVGEAKAAAAAAEAGGGRGGKGGKGGAPKPRFARGAYFLGKAVWGKGYTELLELVEAHHKASSAGAGQVAGGEAAAAPPAPPPPLAVDVYGAGEDLPAVRAEAARRGLPLAFHGARDHADAALAEYKVFVNPSTSDVVATTTAEALAMGKWVVCARHPSNEFFAGNFRNCLTYGSPAEFSERVAHALSHEPHPLAPAERAALSWEAATERFLDVAELGPRELRPHPVAAAAEAAAYSLHAGLCGVEALRVLGGAGAGTAANPPAVDAYEPPAVERVGIFDDKRRVAAAAAAAAPAAAGK